MTNAQFAEFVAATGYVTVAEKPLDPALYPGVAEEDLLPGALVFRPTPGPVDLRRLAAVVGLGTRRVLARSRSAPAATSPARQDHPVVQVAYPDAAAYAAWAGRRLPTEAEFEYAARAGSETTYAWGDEPTVDGALMANTWQGRFPYRNDGALGWVGTSPVGTFPPNGFGLVDMIGNVWEWTTTQFSAHHQRAAAAELLLPAAGEPGSDASARPSRAARTCAHRSTATATGPPPDRRSHRTAPRRTSDSGAWSTSPDVVNCADLELCGPSPSI